MVIRGGKWEPLGDVLSGVAPGAVSDGFKAIFKYGSATRQTASQLNANTVTMMTGTFGGTYVEVGADLATVLDDGDSLRLLPVVRRGSVQGIADILFLKGVDAGIFRSDTLDYLESKGYASNVKKQLSYILRLYNEEMHVVAPPGTEADPHARQPRRQDGCRRSSRRRHVRDRDQCLRAARHQAASGARLEQGLPAIANAGDPGQ
jgi:hypothetical protein